MWAWSCALPKDAMRRFWWKLVRKLPHSIYYRKPYYTRNSPAGAWGRRRRCGHWAEFTSWTGFWQFWNLKSENFEIWNLKFGNLKSENFDEKIENFRTNFFLKTNFSNRSKYKWPAGHGATFIFRALSGQSNWGRSFSRKSKNLSKIPVWGDLTRSGFWKCLRRCNFRFGRPNHFPRELFFSKSSILSTLQLQGQW